MFESLFAPNSVAVIGASREAGKVGHDILTNLIKGGFAGKIIPVNPAGGELQGLEVCSNLKEYPGTIDQAVIAVPKESVHESVKNALAKGAKSIIIITSGFKETGDIGAMLEDEISLMVNRGGARLLGPNCLGVINTRTNLNSSFAGDMPIPGKIAVFSQSGALCTSILELAKENIIGISKLISIGNKADINENDLLSYFANDDDTDVVVGYLENIVSGNRFIKAATELSQKKPVVILKSGTSEVGQRAASSHTGVLSGTDTAYGAAFKRSGVIRADSFDALFDYASALSMQPLPKGNRVLIISNAGGPGTMAADAVEHSGLKVAELSSNLSASLRDKHATAARIPNPINVLGDAPPERYSAAIIDAQNDDTVDAVIVILTPQAMTNPGETARAIALSMDGSKPVLAVFMGGKSFISGRNELKAANLPDFDSPERAVAALKVMHQYAAWRQRPPRMVTRFRVNRRRAEKVITRNQRNVQLQLNEVKSKKILDAYGFSIPQGKLITSVEEATEYARRIGFPVAMKIVSPDIIHKSDMGGVKLNLHNAQQVQDGYDLMMMRISQKIPTARIEGVYMENMVDSGLEVILGMSRDPQFGPMLMFGLGGIFVEVLKDVTFHLAPITSDEAVQMLMSTRSYEILKGKRGEQGVDIHSIAVGLQRMSQLTTDFPQIMELDINPYIVGEIGSEPIVADARMTLAAIEQKSRFQI